VKKALYIILLVVEFVAGFGLLTLVSGGAIGWTYFAIVTAVWAALMAWLLVKLKRAAGSGFERKAKRNVALGMLIPLLGAIGGLVGFVMAFSAAGLL
jgi:hypothetical protein